MIKLFFKNVWLLLKRTFHEFNDDNGPVLAAAVAYFALVSVFPLLLLILAGAGRILGSEYDTQEALTQFVAEYVPGALGTVNEAVDALVQSQGVVSGIAALGLLWAGSQVLFYLEMAMNMAWDCPSRAWWNHRLRSMLLTVLAQVLLMLYFAMSVVSLAQALLSRLPFYADYATIPLLSILPWAISFVLSIVIFVALIKVLPNCKVPWRAAVIGGVVSSVLFEAARLGFRFYLQNFAQYDALFGSIGGLIILLIWTYYGIVITLVGAELASEVEEVFFDGPRRAHKVRDTSERQVPALDSDDDSDAIEEKP